MADSNPSDPSGRPPASASKSDSSMGAGLKIVIGCAVALPILLFCGGILAALAVPAFVQYLNRSKAAEADAETRRIADQVVQHFNQNCDFPPALPRTAPIYECTDGQKCTQDQQVIQQWSEAEIEPGFDREMYFSYWTRRSGRNTYEVRAEHNFMAGEPYHTATIEIRGDHQRCTAEAASPFTENEFR